MDLSEQDLKKIKSLHVMLKMPIWILERETNRVLKSYKSIYKHPISYEFKEKNISDEVVRFYSGMLNEIFLCLWYQDVRIVIGAFRINNVTSTEFSHVYDNLTPENKKIFVRKRMLGILLFTSGISTGRYSGLSDSSWIFV